jgi:hypothetical protein
MLQLIKRVLPQGSNLLASLARGRRARAQTCEPFSVSIQCVQGENSHA